MKFVQWEQVVGLKEPPKWQTRRPCKDEDEEYTWCSPTVDDGLVTGHRIIEVVEIDKDGNHRVKWAVDESYPVERPDGKTVGYFQLEKIRRQRLDQISDDDCVAEGIIETDDGWYCPLCGGWFWAAERAYRHLWNIHCNYLDTEHEWVGGWAASDIAEKLPYVWVLEWPPIGKAER